MIVLFAVGAGYALLSITLGDWFGVDFSPGELPYLSPTVIATFLTVFGGVGYLLLHQTGLGAFVVAGLSLVAALAVSAAVLFLVVVPLQAAQKGVAPSAKSMIGLEAEVVTAIEPGRLGEIVYVQSDARHSAPARTLGITPIPQGAAVRIAGESAGTFVVEPI